MSMNETFLTPFKYIVERNAPVKFEDKIFRTQLNSNKKS